VRSKADISQLNLPHGDPHAEIICAGVANYCVLSVLKCVAYRSRNVVSVTGKIIEKTHGIWFWKNCKNPDISVGIKKN